MSNLKYAIFDVGNTIYPFSLIPLCRYMEKHTEEPSLYHNNHSPRFYDYNPYMKGELTNAEFIKELCFFCRVPYNEKRLQEINIAYHQCCGTPFPETIKAMELLRQNKIEICLLTNAISLLGDTCTGLTKPEFAFTSYDLHLLKPDPEIFKTVLDKLHVAPQEILFIDDKNENVNTAHTLGINGIVFQKETILKELNCYLPPFPNLHRSRED